MICCTTPRTSSLSLGLYALLASVFLIFGAHAQAQQIRNFPPKALRGQLMVVAPPQVKLDGQKDRLSPGARIHNAQNMLTLSGTLVGRTLTVNYLRDTSGLIHEVWILTPAEAALKRPTAKKSTGFSLFGSD